jgi:uncharacterized membrane protein
MIALLKEKKMYLEFLFLGFLSLSCFLSSVFRVIYTNSSMFLFLNWNLFLAFIPWAIIKFINLKPKYKKSRIMLPSIFVVWLLFFPNAPYNFTDLFHLKKNLNMPVWFDLIMILLFAFTGLLFGFISLWNIEKLLEKKLKKKWRLVFSSLFLFIGSFGIYLGRYLRWNSWDIVNKPGHLLIDISELIFNPFNNPRAWGMTIFMGFFLNIIYWSFYFIKEKKIVI